MTDQAAIRSNELLTSFLADSDARCPACRYALRGCTSDRCPECGTQLMLRIGSGRESSAWWLAGLIGLNISIAVILLCLIGLGTGVVTELQHPGLRAQVRSGFASSGDLPRWTPIMLLTIMLVALTLIMSYLATRHDAFARTSNRQRAVLGLLAAASPLITLGLIAMIAASH
jgi:predicted RNA-binding Zn-ribbon protein involved in translation (DUF1610 family)